MYAIPCPTETRPTYSSATVAFAAANAGVDVREPERYEKGHIPEAVSIPYSEEPDFLEKFEKKNAIVICCDRGNLSAKVTLRMRKAGYPAYSLAGGYEGYKRFQK